MDSYKIRMDTRTKYLLGLTCLILTTVVCAAFSFTGEDNFDLARQEIMLRKIGHEVLLHSGDSTSRVLPVSKIATNEYRITFENQFTFQPDSLVRIVSRALAKDDIAHNYVVNVLSCTGKDVIFGYAISKNKQDDIVPCRGREQPKGCYLIDVKFQPPLISNSQKGYLIGGLPFLAFVGLLLSRSVKTKKNHTDALVTENNEAINIGNTLFDPQKRTLFTSGSTTELTVKEHKLLLIFARSPNLVIERGRLQKEIWEDEGVIVGRSLDMFISKLRKKLENDPSVQLVNIHGKGYKLQV